MRLRIIAAIVLLSGLTIGQSAFSAGKPAAKPPAAKKYAFQDFKLPIETRVADLVKQMTLDEKISVLHSSADAIPRLGIMKFNYGNECLHGIIGPGKFTVFPMPIAMASSWDPEMVNRVATAISDEAWGALNRDEKQVGYPGVLFHAFWAPTINMARDPRWGRTGETYGEDPFLTGRFAVAYVKGIQGSDPKYIKAVSTPKHFVANNEDHNRDYCNAKISERALREYYLPAFHDAVVEGGAQAVMGAYNAVNGVPCNANRWLMVDVLRNDWGFNGYAVTDCGAPHNIYAKHKYVKTPPESAAAVLNAGVAVECGGNDVLRKNVREALKKGHLTEATLDRAITEAMTVRFRLGMFDPRSMNPYTKIPASTVGSAKHVELARQASRESIVLLKNDAVNGAPLLPLDAKSLKSVAVVGRNAAVLLFGDYSGTPVNKAYTPLEGIKSKAGKNVKVNAVEWIPTPDQKEFAPVGTDNLRWVNAEYYDNAEFAGAPAVTQVDREINLKPANVPAAAAAKGPLSARWSGKLIPSKSGAHYLYMNAGGDSRIFINGELVLEKVAQKKKKPVKVSNLMDTYYTDVKEEFKTATLMLEAGREYDVKVEYASAKGVAQAAFEWVQPSAANAAARSAEMKAIRESDAVIAVIGLQLGDEKETVDRHDLDISNDQIEYVKQLLKLNPKTVVVLINGGPVSVNWIAANAPAIMEAWYPGEQGGNAIADALFGDFNPAGRLPVTVHKSVDDLPAFDDYEITRGRTYKYFSKEVLYPFGYGLSYTKFDYSGLSIDKKSAGAADTVNVSAQVKNTGGRDGDEVVQVYVHKMESSVKRPISELRGFKRVYLKAGEEKTVTIPLEVKRLAFWDDQAKKFAVEPGKYEIFVGASSADIRLKGAIAISVDGLTK
ncbi:MAG: glycoside hydrolase family 3 C-terminal domain-containing protein [bacterium]